MIRTILLGFVAISSATAMATETTRDSRPRRLADVVAYIESTYPAEVVAVELDPAGDKPAHYHVEMRFPRNIPVALDVDAATLDVVSREPTLLSPASATMYDALRVTAAHLPGIVTFAVLDAVDGTPAHYDVDVRLPRGDIARIKIDAATREIGWRKPAIAPR